jgi:hypothetical protein
MATRRRPPARAGATAWISTLLVGTVLIGAGFGAGVLLGVVTEEPSVITGLLGGGERIALAGALDGDEGMDSSAVPQAVDREGRRGTAEPPAALAAAEAGLPAVSTPPSGFAVQVGAFGSAEAARAMAAKLEAAGYPGFVSAGATSRDRRWRARVGPFADRADADRTAALLESNEGLSTWIVSLDDER